MNTEKNYTQKKEETGIAENGINKKEVEGREINHQVKERREIHQPRDNA